MLVNSDRFVVAHLALELKGCIQPLLYLLITELLRHARLCFRLLLGGCSSERKNLVE